MSSKKFSSKPTFFILFLVLFVFILPAFGQKEKKEADHFTAEEALEWLMRGNEHFVQGKLTPKDVIRERAKLVAGQKPYAIVLACADSRVPPELVFDESLGRIFVIRIAGNVVDPDVLGSIEYAVEHLHVPLLFVLGHDNCGAVKAKLSGGHFPPNIAALLSHISPAVNKVRTLDLDEKSSLAMSVKENVGYQMQMAVYESEVLREAVREKHLKIAGGVYHLDTGKVDIVSTEVALQSFDEKEPNLATEKVEKKEAESKAAETKKAEPKELKEKAREEESNKIEKSEPRVNEKQKKAEPVKTEKQEKRAPVKTSEPPAKLSKDEIVAENKTAETKSVGYKTAAVTMRPKTFQEALRFAFENKTDVITKKSLMMRDEQDRCVTFDCRHLPAGETIKILSPFILNIGGHPSIKVRYKGQNFYVYADATDFEFLLS